SLKARLRERAAYYLANPDVSSRDPFDEVILLLNGRAIDWTLTDSLTLAVRCRFLRDHNDSYYWGVPLDADFHLVESTTETDVEIQVRLITPSDYPTSGWAAYEGVIQSYATIRMPGGEVMHKALNTVRLSPGDPDRVCFELRPAVGHNYVGTSIPMTLRLISRGLRRDIQLSVTPESEREEDFLFSEA
ncbi:MAG TPA: hypothetical protein VF614_13370, partial [Chthoniobacteraceae bacterium]